MAQSSRRRSSRDAESRAEARRRARQGAGTDREPDDDEGDVDSAGRDRPPRPNLLQRMFVPPAAPLPDKPDPLAGFSHSGPSWLRAPAAGVHVLRANPVIWLVAGLVWAVARLFESSSAIGFVASMVEFGALIGAGYLGWQRPWLYGLAAAVTGLIFLLAYAVYQITSSGVGFDPGFIGVFVLYFGLPTVLLGALAGWFGGYWRRRLAEARTLREAARHARR
ncbi:MAG: hypothetical protein ABR509_07195 [Candidatus Limnocylindria bacterium]